jgi:hypothetical protein
VGSLICAQFLSLVEGVALETALDEDIAVKLSASEGHVRPAVLRAESGTTASIALIDPFKAIHVGNFGVLRCEQLRSFPFGGASTYDSFKQFYTRLIRLVRAGNPKFYPPSITVGIRGRWLGCSGNIRVRRVPCLTSLFAEYWAASL